MPIRLGNGTAIDPQGFQEVRLGDGTVLWSSDGGDGGGTTGSQYHWTAEDYAVGDTPTEWAATNATISIAEDASGRKYLDIDAPNETRSFIEYTPAESAENGEVWARWRTGTSGDIWVFLRGQSLDTPGSMSMTRTDYMPENNLDRLSEFDNGSFNLITDQALTTSPDTVGQVRAAFDADTLQGRWWDDGATEPGTWDLSGVTNVTGSGAAGVGHWRGSDIRLYEFGVGTAGASAPTSPV